MGDTEHATDRNGKQRCCRLLRDGSTGGGQDASRARLSDDQIEVLRCELHDLMFYRGPQRAIDITRRFEIHKKDTKRLLSHNWFMRSGDGLYSITMTQKGGVRPLPMKYAKWVKQHREVAKRTDEMNEARRRK